MKFKIERLGGMPVMHVSECCSNCTSEVKSKRRDFSEQAWTVLVLWNEVQRAAVDQPLCESCYNELREVLIDRADEIEAAIAEPATGKKTGTRTQGRKPVRKAS